MAACAAETAAEALALAGAGAGDAALALLAPALAAAPEDPSLAAAQARALLVEERGADALAPALTALQARPDDPALWHMLAEAMAAAGLGGPARQALAQAAAFGLPRQPALALAARLDLLAQAGPPRPDPAGAAPDDPATPPALLDAARGMLADHAAGRHAEVAAAAREAVRRWPHHVAGHEFLATALEALGDAAGAAGPAARVAEMLPADPVARARLHRLRAAARPGRAASPPDPFGTALPADAPAAAEAWARAERLTREGRAGLAIAAYEDAAAAAPGIAEIAHNLAALLQAEGRHDEAIGRMREAVAAKPGSVHLRLALGSLLAERGRHAEAEAEQRAAVALDPAHPEARLFLAMSLLDQHRLPEAEAEARAAAGAGADDPAALSVLGHVLQLQGRLAEARALFRAALARDPGNLRAISGQLFCETHGEDVGPAALRDAHLAYGARVEAAVAPARHARRGRAHAGPPRLGFVSGDLRGHALVHFAIPTLGELARRGFELVAYMTNANEDHVSDAIRPVFARWQGVHALPDAALARRIRDDRVDILFDLSGHTAHHRLPVFAARPAPVQVTWLGYPGTTGLTRMDYYVANAVMAPPGLADAQMTERIVRLPVSTTFDAMQRGPAVAPLPAAARGGVTFGSFNRFSKLTPPVLAAWARVLAAVPEARLVVGAVPDEAAGARLRAALAAQGVEPGRVVLRPRLDFPDYLAAHAEVDLLLDAFPYAGGTSTCFALWLGVPTVTLAGDTLPARCGASLLTQLGLEAFVAASVEDYVARAAAWAARLEELAALRAGLRARLEAAMTDPTAVVDGLELALHAMWQRWCHGLPPAAFDVTPGGAVVVRPA